MIFYLDNPIIIRKATYLDISNIVGFNNAMALETEGKTLDYITLKQGVSEILSDPLKGFYLIAVFSGTVVGQLMITSEWSDWRNGYFWWIQSVYIKQDHRKRGVYRALNEEVLSLAKNNGNICGIRLYVDRDNTIAQKVYHNLGMSTSNYDMYEIEFDQ